MPLYKITHGDDTRLVKASSSAAALKHVTSPLFTVSAVTDPAEAAEIAAGGVKLETAGELSEDKVPNTPQSAAMAGMLADTLANGAAK